jgi:predicted  nucleic acid-binding Zn-ribbon protein
MVLFVVCFRHDKKCKDFLVAEKNSASFEKSYNELTGKFNQVQAERKKAVDDLKELEKEAEKLRKQTEAQRKQLDDEMLGRVEAENQLQSAREELALRDQVNNKIFACW